MATDITTDEACSDNHSTEEKTDVSMTELTDMIKEDTNDDSASEDPSDTSVKRIDISDDGDSDESTPEFIVSDPIDIEVPHDEDVTEDVVSKTNSRSSLLDIHDIQILDDPSNKKESSKSNSDTISISDCSNSDKSVDDEDTTKDSGSKNSAITAENENISVNSSINVKPPNVMVLNPKSNFSDKQMLSNDLLKGQRVFILNGNVISKEEVEKTKPDNINIICVSNNLNDILTNIKNDTIKAGCALLAPETADKAVVLKNIEKLIAANHNDSSRVKHSQGPKFIQLVQSNYQQISPKINVTTATTTASAVTIPKVIAPKPTVPSASKSNDTLKTKVIDNEGTPSNQNQTSESLSGVKKISSLSVMKKDGEPESPAVARARCEFNKCRKQLIEAAIHPQLPTYKPPVTYEGPIFSCEECDDTFSCTDSLRNHKNRRSVLFTYNCPPCNCTLEFYNRCTFLLHVRSHDAAVKACYLTISTIPSSKLNFKLLQPDEVEPPTVPPLEKPIQRSKERLISRKNSEESNDSTPRAEIKENGTNKPKITLTTGEQTTLLKNFDFIKSLHQNKFKAYLKDTIPNPEFTVLKTFDKKSDSESNLSDDSSDDDDESNSSQDVPTNDTSSLNGSASTSQLKYFLTTSDCNTTTTTPATLKRPTENGPQHVEETANKKHKVNETPVVDIETESESVQPKIKHTPIIIKTKPSPTKPHSVEKVVDEIILTSSDGEEESDEDNSADENKTVVCRECRTEVLNLSKHIRAENKPLKEFLCEHCKFFSPSRCALQAHIRMHSKTQPYICPDCGFYFNTYETFQTHVKQVCYYDFKAIRFQCPECSMLKPSVQAFADHLKLRHTKDVFKCSLCITSSYMTKVVELHIKKKHVGEEGSILEGYRCMLCPNILISKKSIDTHINKHVFSLKHLRYVYICKRCKKYASGKRNKFVQHLNECDEKKKEPVVKPKETVVKPIDNVVVKDIDNIVVKPKETKDKTSPTKPTSNKATSTSKPNRSRSLKSSGKKDVEVEEKDPLTVEEWEADKLKAQYVPKTKICVMCRSADISSRSHSLFCNACVCSVNADDTSESSESARHDSGRPKRRFKCRLCKQFMNKDWATITKHYEQDHHSDLNSKGETRSRQPKDKDKEKEKEKEAESKKSDNATPVNIIKKRRLSAKETPPAKSPKMEEIPVYGESPPDTYKCVHCHTTTDNREEFQTHIVTHKDPNNMQCPECGECFMVCASLAKHLLIAHHVRNLRRYWFENDLFKKDEPIERVKDLNDNQCDVCLMQCDSKQSYDKHLRTHGMKFVALQSRSKGEKPRCGLVRI